jgi:hypothetical protein
MQSLLVMVLSPPEGKLHLMLFLKERFLHGCADISKI